MEAIAFIAPLNCNKPASPNHSFQYYILCNPCIFIVQARMAKTAPAESAWTPPLKKAKLSKGQLYKPPTNEELNSLKETENLYQSHLFRLQVRIQRHWTLLVVVKDQSSHLVCLNICIKYKPVIICPQLVVEVAR